MKLARLKLHRVYLAGPMEQMGDNGETWRDKATPILQKMGIGVFSPTDKATELAPEDKTTRQKINDIRNSIRLCLEQGQKDAAEVYMRQLSEFADDIVSVDLRMVDLADFTWLHVDPDIHMCGSYNEQSHACLQRKPVIIFCPKGIWRIPGWLYGHCHYKMFFTTFEESLRYIQHIHEDEYIDRLGRWKFFDYNKVYGV